MTPHTSSIPRSLAAVAAVLLLTAALSSCTRSDESTESEGDGGSTTTADQASNSADGEFGDLGKICGPGDASGATARGVTDTEIHVSTISDPGNTFQPGLGQEYFDVATAFTSWCNEAGGINGRKIVVTNRDSKLLELGAAMTAACQTDFMSVGSANVLDAPGVAIREGCDMAAIPAIAMSPENRSSDLQVLASPNPNGESNLAGALRSMATNYPDAAKAMGSWWPDTPSVTDQVVQTLDVAEQVGITVVKAERLPLQVDNYRPYGQIMADAGVKMWFEASKLFQGVSSAMADVGWTPEVMMTQTASYEPITIDQIEAGSFPPTFVPAFYVPFELADENPATAQALEILDGTSPEERLTVAALTGLDAWLLWAKAATACGSTLTGDCVLEQARTETEWTAGGLKGPVDVSTQSSPTCFLMLEATRDGFELSEKLTAPTDGFFNCSPENVAKVDG